MIKVLVAKMSMAKILKAKIPDTEKNIIRFYIEIDLWRAESRSKNDNPAACGTKTTFTER